MPSSCAVLGGFAIGGRVSLLRQRNPNAKCQRVLELVLCLVLFVLFIYDYSDLNYCLSYAGYDLRYFAAVSKTRLFFKFRDVIRQ